MRAAAVLVLLFLPWARPGRERGRVRVLCKFIMNVEKQAATTANAFLVPFVPSHGTQDDEVADRLVLCTRAHIPSELLNFIW